MSNLTPVNEPITPVMAGLGTQRALTIFIRHGNLDVSRPELISGRLRQGPWTVAASAFAIRRWKIYLTPASPLKLKPANPVATVIRLIDHDI